MKYRQGGTSKIKYEHSMIQGLRKLLESLESWIEIKAIIPGRIHPTNKSQALRVKVQYHTTDGLKCLALSGSAVQEVFFVSSEAEILKLKLEEYFK